MDYLEQMTLPKSEWPSFCEEMDAFVALVPPEKRYSKGAGYMVKGILLKHFSLPIHTEHGAVMFNKQADDNSILYMQVGQEAYSSCCIWDGYIATIIKVTDSDWSVSFARFVFDANYGGDQYRHIKNYGKPIDIGKAFLEYRDRYLCDIEREEERKRYLETHPAPDPEPCLKAFPKEEPVKHGWLMRLMMKLIPG